MGQSHAALVVAMGAGMGGDEGALMRDLHGLPCPPLHLDALPHIGRGHRVAVGLDRDQAIAGHRPQQTGLEEIGWRPQVGAPVLCSDRLGRLAKGGSMNPLVGHARHPRVHRRVQGLPVGQRLPEDETARDVLHARFHLALRLRPIGPAQARRAPIVAREIPKQGVPGHDSTLWVAFQHHRFGMIVEHLLRQAAKPVKGVFMTGHQRGHLLSAGTLARQAPGRAQHQHQHLDTRRLPANLGPRRAPVHLGLPARGGFKPPRGLRQPLPLSA
jgi:hypothetical protein